METEKQVFIFPISEEEFTKLKEDNEVIKFYNKPGEPLPLYVVCVSKRKITEKDMEAVIENGDYAIPIQVTDEKIEQLENPSDEGFALKAEYADIIVVVLSAKEHEKAVKERENDATK